MLALWPHSVLCLAIERSTVQPFGWVSRKLGWITQRERKISTHTQPRFLPRRKLFIYSDDQLCLGMSVGINNMKGLIDNLQYIANLKMQQKILMIYPFLIYFKWLSLFTLNDISLQIYGPENVDNLYAIENIIPIILSTFYVFIFFNFFFICR